MALTVGGTPVNAVYVGSTPVTAVYVGAEKIWPTIDVVRITLGTGAQAQDQFRAALTERGLSYQTVTEVPFDIELVGTGSARSMFWGCSALTSVPDMDTSQVTDMNYMFASCSTLTSVPDMDTSSVTNMSSMFSYCSSLTHAPDMDTSQVTSMSYMFEGCSSLTYVPDLDTGQVTSTYAMFYDCAALTDGNVRLIGKHPNVSTTDMITGSGLTREPFYTTDGQPWPTAEVHEVSLTDVQGNGTVHPLVSVTVPAGETWSVRIQGTVTKSGNLPFTHPTFRIGSTDSGAYGQGSAVDFSGTVTAANSSIGMVTKSGSASSVASFVGTVTIEK